MQKFLYAFILLSLQINTGFSITPVVISVSPVRQILNAPRGASIIVNFNTALNISTVNSSSFRVFGKQSGPVPGAFEFLNGNTQIKFTPTDLFLAGEWVTVNLSKGILSNDNAPMIKGYSWNFWTIALPGTLNQTLINTIQVRRNGEGPIQSYGALGVDLNDDGLTDLAVVNEITKDFRVFLNNGNNYDTILAIHSVPNGFRPSVNEAADFNNDGKVDIVIGNGGNNIMSLFIANGGGYFQPGVSYTAAQMVLGVAVNDFDGDGFDDIITANRGGSNIALFKNNGNSTFASAQLINTVGNNETCLMMADANNDGTLDAFIGCYGSNEIVLMLGNGNGNFTFSSRSGVNGPPWAVAVGDLNGDGNVDVAASLSTANKIGVIFGNGAGGLGAVTNYNASQFPLAMDIGDVDGDNDLDLISSNIVGANFNVFANNGSGIFTNTPVILPSVSAGSCITVHDRDNDGDLDLAGIDEVEDLLFIFNNQPPPQIIKLNLKVIPEGSYISQSNQLARKDSFTVYLRNNSSPFELVDSSKQVIDSLSYSGMFFFNNAPTDTYYISIEHLNSIETWSKAGGEYLMNDGTIYNYDFTSASLQAYGNNLKLKSGKYCLYSGDVNQDGFITLYDLIPVYNDGINFISGRYITTDLTGDNIVDLTDVTLCYNNSVNFVRVRRP